MKIKCQICGKTCDSLRRNRKFCNDCQKFQKAQINKMLHKEKMRANVIKTREKTPIDLSDSLGVLPSSSIIKGQTLQLCRDVHNALEAKKTYGQYMAIKKEQTSYET